MFAALPQLLTVFPEFAVPAVVPVDAPGAADAASPAAPEIEPERAFAQLFEALAAFAAVRAAAAAAAGPTAAVAASSAPVPAAADASPGKTLPDTAIGVPTRDAARATLPDLYSPPPEAAPPRPEVPPSPSISPPSSPSQPLPPSEAGSGVASQPISVQAGSPPPPASPARAADLLSPPPVLPERPASASPPTASVTPAGSGVAIRFPSETGREFAASVTPTAGTVDIGFRVPEVGMALALEGARPHLAEQFARSGLVLGQTSVDVGGQGGRPPSQTALVPEAAGHRASTRPHHREDIDVIGYA
jgi:hypothetical protein